MAKTMITKESIMINRNINDVYALVSDPSQTSPLSPNFIETTYGGGEMQAGDQWTFTSTFMGREITSDIECIETSSPSLVKTKLSSDSADIDVQWILEPLDGGTQLTYYSEGQPKGFFAGIAANMVKGTFEKSIRQFLENIKSHLES